VLATREDDVVFSAAKLFFAYGLGNALTFPLAVGATTILMAERPNCRRRSFRRLTTHKPTLSLWRAHDVDGNARGQGIAGAQRRRDAAVRLGR
jgi:acyl-coenzyme A synthetase/AMP-(fatty) acid ligase